jgi:CelD/BcsL family acetyltransferase involved in cellulose biosynthesis
MTTLTTPMESLSAGSPAASVVVSSHRGGVEVLNRFAVEWNELSDHAVEDQPFFRPDWIRAYLRAFEPQCKLLVVTARVAGRLVLILPLIDEIATFSKVPVRRLRAPVNGSSSRFDAVRRAGHDEEAAIVFTWQHLREMGGWDLLLFRDALEGSTVSRLAALATTDRLHTLRVPDQPSPFVPVPSDPGQLERMPANSKLRSQLKQIRLRLKQHGTLKFSCTHTADPAALERFYRLEVSGWKAGSRDSILDGGLRGFYDEVAKVASRDGYFSLYTLELNDTLIAAHYSLTHRDRCYSPKVAYNEDFKAFAPGHLIIAEILKDCCARGIRGFDITGQDQPWKMKWATQARPASHHFIFKGPVGALAHAVGTSLKPSAWKQGQQTA